MYFYIKYIGKLQGLVNEFHRSMVFETVEFERPKFNCSGLIASFKIEVSKVQDFLNFELSPMQMQYRDQTCLSMH